ncbi:hypothetical protein DFH29DRAFT_1002677 [Suillus ampliporus]|nr:hypothetical protein DFH29DRAFT_1002677 [Suillus ampliporus]
MTRSSRSDPGNLQHQQVWLAVAAVIICAQIQVAKMAQKGPQQPKAQWNSDEIDAFLSYLISAKSTMAGTNFKDTTFNEAAQHIASKRTHGPLKSGAQCGNKWGSLKLTYNAIKAYHSKSGCHWDNEHGANIEGPAAEAVWEEYIAKKSNAALKLFKTIGWSYHSKMEQILPRHSSAQGTAAYHPILSAPHDEQPVASASTSSAPRDADVSMSDADIPQPDISWGAPPPIPAFAGGSMSIAPPMSSVPLSSGSSAGKRWHSEMTHGHSAPPSTVWTSVSQMTKPESEKKLRLSTASGKTRPSTSKKNVQDTANTAVLMNLQGTINRLSDSLNTNFSTTDEGRVAEHRSRALKLIQSTTEISTDDKVLLMHVLMTNPAACDIILDVDDPELRVAFLRSMIVCARQEDPTL